MCLLKVGSVAKSTEGDESTNDVLMFVGDGVTNEMNAVSSEVVRQTPRVKEGVGALKLDWG